MLSDEHFTVDGTFLEAWASQESFKPADGSGEDDPNRSGGRNPTVDFKGHARSNEIHASVTDPDAGLRRKGGDGAKLAHNRHVVTENRNGLVVAAMVTKAEGDAEVKEAPAQLGVDDRGTVGADNGYDQRAFTEGVRWLSLSPHVARDISGTRGSTIDGRTTRHPGYAVSQRRRKMVEEVFGWMKTVGLMRKLRHRGTALVDRMFEFTAAAYNLVRMRRLLPEAAFAAVS